MKKLLSILMCLLVLTLMCPVVGALELSDSYLGTMSLPEDSHITTLTRYNIRETDAAEVVVPHNITGIDTEAFTYCNDVDTITLHADIRHIGENAFLGTAYYDNPANWQEGVLYIGTCLIKADSDKISSTYVVRDGTTLIANEAFRDCKNLDTIIIPDTVKYVGADAFTGTGFYNNHSNWKDGVLTLDHLLLCVNTNLSGKFTVDESVRTIAENAFLNCKNITQVITSDSLEHIGEFAFSACRSLNAIHLGRNLETLGEGCFNTDSDLEVITVSTDNLHYTVQDGILYNKELTELVRCPQSTSGTVTAADTVQSISACAFESCTSIDEVILPENFQSISDAAFSYSGIRSITLPEDLTYIGNFAFSRCLNLTEIIVPDKVRELGINAFEYCLSLKSVTLGERITALPMNCFMYCESLSDVNLGNHISEISSTAFRSTALLSDTGKYTDGMLIVSDMYLIRVASDTASCNVPDSVRCIANEAFADPLERGVLREISLPPFLNSIDESIFGYSLDGVTLRYRGTTDMFYVISDMPLYDMNISTSTNEYLAGCFTLLLILCLGYGFVLFYAACKEEPEDNRKDGQSDTH
ncbi:MAG: leucine-rich repeat domain-containing protein [Ruminococcus sp.]|nr:leucine-rich repeat domain-containing protein [Ruminococcus sp.]